MRWRQADHDWPCEAAWFDIHATCEAHSRWTRQGTQSSSLSRASLSCRVVSRRVASRRVVSFHVTPSATVTSASPTLLQRGAPRAPLFGIGVVLESLPAVTKGACWGLCWCARATSTSCWLLDAFRRKLLLQTKLGVLGRCEARRHGQAVGSLATGPAREPTQSWSAGNSPRPTVPLRALCQRPRLWERQ